MLGSHFSRIGVAMHTATMLRTVNLVMLAGLIVFTTLGAMAGTDTTFSAIVTTIQGWAEGSLGQLFALAALLLGLGAGLARGSLMAVAVGVGMAVIAYYGPAVIVGITTTVL